MWSITPPEYHLVNLTSIKAMFDWCYGSSGSESYWNGFTSTQTSASNRRSFDYPNGTHWVDGNHNPIYNDSTTNTSYFLTYCGTRIELNSTWMQTTPTWQYDLNACMNWMPYNTFKFTYGANTTKDLVNTADQPLFQYDWYDHNLCHFHNSSSYYPCTATAGYKLREYFNRMDCTQMVTSNFTANNPNYHTFSESYRDTPDQVYRKEGEWGVFTGQGFANADYYAPFGDGIYDYVDWSLDDPYLFSSYWWTDDYGTIYQRLADYGSVEYYWGPSESRSIEWK